MELFEVLGLTLGGTSFMGLITYIVYQVCQGNCASHLKINGRELSIDLKDVENIVENASTPIEKNMIKKEIEEQIKSTLHKVKSKYQNKVDAV